MEIAVVGAGPAGLTAAHRLRGMGHVVTVLEASDVVGGRTHTEHFGPDHWSDDGAGWLASFYPRTLALLAELGQRDRLSVVRLRGGGDLQIDGRIVPNPNSIQRLLTTRLLSPIDKVRFFGWMAALLVRQRGDLRVDDRWDAVSASKALRPIGQAARERVVRPSFEGPFFARLDDMGATLVRSWLRVLSIGTFFHVDGGMDAPWRHLGEVVGVRTRTRVRRIGRDGSGVVISSDGPNGSAAEQFDAVVVAVPAPAARDILEPGIRPAALDGVRYAPHVRLYAARRGPGLPRSGVHTFPNELVATVELGDGRAASWGHCPEGWEWALVCAPSASSAPLLEEPAADVQARLWAEAQRIEPRLFDLASAEIVHLVRWPHAVPLVDVGYYGRLRALPQRPPVVFAGDWLVQPCVEGAVRSGEQAAAAFG